MMGTSLTAKPTSLCIIISMDTMKKCHPLEEDDIILWD